MLPIDGGEAESQAVHMLEVVISLITNQRTPPARTIATPLAFGLSPEFVSVDQQAGRLGVVWTLDDDLYFEVTY